MVLHTTSESVYVGLCLKIGTPQQVAIKRDVIDITELLEHNASKTNQLVIMISGSYREGFRDSDIDIMFWPNNHRVLWDFSQAMMYNTERYALIVCDNSESPPGYTLLKLPLKEADRLVLSSCVRIKESLCISSGKYKTKTQTTWGIPGSMIHGPCSSGTHKGGLEYDYAHCFVSDIWPPSASSWTDRCHSWPPPHVVNDIVRSGCHFVAIGHSLCEHRFNEWRMSFSNAERKLVYAMNHTQFLTFFLLKIFLRDFNRELGDKFIVLCSYHIKTVIFWTIQQNTTVHWCPQNLLAGFWVCFKLLLKWVYEGYCPNFFIPENNMFLTKVYGVVQRNLFTRLYGLYEKGIAFLLQSPSISSYIMNVLCNPRLSVCTDECSLISEVVLDRELFNEIDRKCAIAQNNLHICMEYLHIVKELIRLPLTPCQILTLQKLTVTFLQRFAFMLHDMYTYASGGNRQMYNANKRSCYMLKLAAKFGSISDLLYIAMYSYKTFRHREALSVIEMTKLKLAQPGLMYHKHVDPERYTEAVGGQSWSYKMRHAVARYIRFDNDICYLNELLPEQQSSSQNKENALQIPPWILLDMLEYLCCRHVDPLRAKAALDDLQYLVHFDRGKFVSVPCRDISWEILGICQQMTGNHQAALFSYKQSLRQCNFHNIHTATRNRIHKLSTTEH